jgi:site-specific recombinase XerD
MTGSVPPVIDPKTDKIARQHPWPGFRTEQEDEIARSPMVRVRQPKTPQKLVPVIRDEDTKKLLDACKGKDFVQLRDEALIRL